MSSYNIPDPVIQGFTYSSSFKPHNHLKRYCGRTVPSGSRASFSQLPELPADCLQLSLLGTALSRGKLLHPTLLWCFPGGSPNPVADHHSGFKGLTPCLTWVILKSHLGSAVLHKAIEQINKITNWCPRQKNKISTFSSIYNVKIGSPSLSVIFLTKTINLFPFSSKIDHNTAYKKCMVTR